MSENLVQVDAIVPVYGQWPLAERCIASLLAQTAPPRIVVVDDCSPDDTADRVAERFPDVELVRLPKNLGFAKACNVGFRHGQGEVVILVNSDVQVDERLVELLVVAFEDPSVASASPVIAQPDGRLDAVGICADATVAGYVRFHGSSPAAAGRDTPVVLGPYGAVAAYRRAAVPGDGLFDERIFMYHEELDLALRLRAAGHKSAVVAEAKAVHTGGATTGRGSERQVYLAGFGRGYLLRKYGVLRTRHGARALLTEMIVVALRLIRYRETAAFRGRLAGYRAGRGVARMPIPGTGIDRSIGFFRSLRMRSDRYWAVY